MPGAWETLYVRVRGDSDLQKTFAKDEKAVGKFDKTLGSVFKKYSDKKVSVTVEEDGAAKTAAALKGLDKVADSVDGRSVDLDVDKDGSALKGVEGLSQGFKGLASNIRATGTVLTAASIPFAIAGIGAATPTILALGSSFAGLALNLGKAAAGFGLVAGAAGGGALAGLKTYTALISSTVSASREAYTALNEQAQKQLELQRQQILNTKASQAFNEEIDRQIISLSHLQAGVGSRVFPMFTEEMRAWGGVLRSNRGEIIDTAGEVARIATGFSEWFRTAEDGKVLDRTLGFINSSAIKGASTLHNVGITGVMAFQPLIPLASDLQTKVQLLANTAAEWAKSAEGQKRLGDIYRSLWEDAKRLGPVLMDTGRGLFNIFSAIDRSGLSDQASRGLESIASSFEHVTREGTTSRRKINDFLNSARELMPHVAGAASALWHQIFRVADAAIDARQEGHKLTILQEIFDGIRKSARPLGNLLVGTFKDLGPEIANLLPNLSRFFETFAGSSGPLVTFVRTLNRGLEIFNNLPDPVKHTAANLAAMKLILGTMGVGQVVGPLGHLGANMFLVNSAAAKLNGKKGLVPVAAGLRSIGLALVGGLGIVALAGAFYLAYKNSDKFHDQVNKLATDLATWGKDKFKDAKAAVNDIFDADIPKVKSGASKAANAYAIQWGSTLREQAKKQEGEGSAPYEFGFKVGKSIGTAIDAGLSGKSDKGGKGGKGGSGADNPIGTWIRSHIPTAAWIDDNVADPIVGRIAKGIAEGFKKSKTGKNIFDWIGKQWKETGKLKYEGSPLQQLFQKIRNDSDQTKQGATKDAWDQKRSSIAAWAATHAGAIPIFGKLAGLIAGKSAEAKTKGTQNAWALKQQSQRAYTAQHLSAIPIFGKILEVIVTKTAEAKSKGTKNAWDQQRSTKNAWDAILDAAPIWLRIAEAVIDPTRTVVSQVKTAWSDLLNFLADVVSRLGFKDLAASIRGSVPAGKGSTYGGSAPGGDNPNTKPVEHFARGGIHKADRGGIAGPGRMGIVGEAGDDEAIVNLKRRTPESQMAFRAASRSPNARGHISGVGEGLGATSYAVAPEIRKRADAIARATGTAWNTYQGHGEPGGSTQDYTVDFWGGARGTPLSASQGFKTADLALTKYNSAPPVLYVIRQGEYWRGGSWQPWPQDPHYDHTHVSWVSPHGASVGSGFSVPNPIQVLYDKLWPQVKGMANRFISPLTSSSKILNQVAGRISKSAVDKFGQMLDAKIPDTIGGGAGGQFAGQGGTPEQNRALGKKMLSASGLPGSWGALNSLWQRESGWNQYADNPTSAAYGIPQANPGSKMGPAANPPKSDPAAQIDWGLGYIRGRYGSTDKAWGHSQSTGWYARGGIAGPGRLGIVGEAGDDEAIINLNRRTRESQMAFRAAAKSPNGLHRFASGGVLGRPSIGMNLQTRHAAAAQAGMNDWNALGSGPIFKRGSGWTVRDGYLGPGIAGLTNPSTRTVTISPIAKNPAKALVHELGHVRKHPHTNAVSVMAYNMPNVLHPTPYDANVDAQIWGAPNNAVKSGTPHRAPGGGSGAGGYGGSSGGSSAGNVNRNSIHMSGGGGSGAGMARTYSGTSAAAGRRLIENAVAGWGSSARTPRVGTVDADIRKGREAGEAQLAETKGLRRDINRLMKMLPDELGAKLMGRPGEAMHQRHQRSIRDRLEAAGVH